MTKNIFLKSIQMCTLLLGLLGPSQTQGSQSLEELKKQEKIKKPSTANTIEVDEIKNLQDVTDSVLQSKNLFAIHLAADAVGFRMRHMVSPLFEPEYLRGAEYFRLATAALFLGQTFKSMHKASKLGVGVRHSEYRQYSRVLFYCALLHLAADAINISAQQGWIPQNHHTMRGLLEFSILETPFIIYVFYNFFNFVHQENN